MTLEEFKQDILDYVKQNEFSGEDWDRGYAEAAKFIFNSLDIILNEEPEIFDATAARKILEKNKNVYIEENLKSILESVREAAENQLNSVNVYVDLSITDRINERLESLGFMTSIESATSGEDLINIAW